MTIEILVFLLIALLTVLAMAKNTFVTQENQRLVILKMGKLEKIVGPGLSFTVPFIDLGFVVELSKILPNWQEMSEDELRAKITKLVKSNPDPKVYV